MNFYKNKKILITGGLGFIGSNLAKKLVNQGALVTIIDNLNPLFGGNLYNIKDFSKNLQYQISDIRDNASMENLIVGKDYLFNLAAQTSHLDSMNDPITDLEINTDAQLRILEICRIKNPEIKIIFTSTRQIYGKPKYLPVDEFHPIQPVDVNGINKHAAESYHLLYHNVYGLNSTILRLTNTYGPGMRIKDARQTFVGIWIKMLLENIPISIFGDGNQLRDFNYVDDCVEALLIAGSNNNSFGKIYNLGSTEVISLKNLAELMIDTYKSGSYTVIPFPTNRKAIDIGDYYSNFELIKNDLNWIPKTNLYSGIIQTLEFYKENQSKFLI